MSLFGKRPQSALRVPPALKPIESHDGGCSDLEQVKVMCRSILDWQSVLSNSINGIEDSNRRTTELLERLVGGQADHETRIRKIERALNLESTEQAGDTSALYQIPRSDHG